MIDQILANGLCLLCCYKWDSDPEAAFPDDGGGDHREDEAVAVSSESSGRSDEPIIALRTVEPLQVRSKGLLLCCPWIQITEMGERVGPRLRELASRGRRKPESGIHAT